MGHVERGAPVMKSCDVLSSYDLWYSIVTPVSVWPVLTYHRPTYPRSRPRKRRQRTEHKCQETGNIDHGNRPAFAPKVATPGLPAWVDVRNIADAHAKALQLPQGTSERFLLCGGVDYLEDGIQGLRARGEKGLGEVGARCDPSKHFAIDRSRAEKMLEVSFIPFERTVEDAWESMKSLGFVE
jgi:hypothetical protein